MPPRRMISRALGIVATFVALSLTPALPAEKQGKELLPGSKLTLRQAAERADAIAIGRRFRPLMGGNIGENMVVAADTEIEECLKGDLPRGKLRIAGVTFRPPERLPSPERLEDQRFLFFITRGEVKGKRVHGVIKMLRATPENVGSARKLQPKRQGRP